MFRSQFEQLAHRRLGRDDDRIANDAGLELLDGPHFAGLGLERHVLVHDADAAFLGHGDREARLRHRVHGRRYEGDVEGDVARQAGRQVDFGRQDLGVGRHEEDVVEGECFVRDPEHCISSMATGSRTLAHPAGNSEYARAS